MSTRFILTALLMVALLPFVACTRRPEPLQTHPDFLGFITEIQPGQINVESHADKVVDRYIVTINEDTAIFKKEGGKLYYVSTEALETKRWVQIWFFGPVMESWPKQATAGQIVIQESITIR